ncbi:AAA family ATPase, partial [Selenomonas noxia]
MKKIAFYGKGGIGKSTTAANVSAAFSRMGRRVCQIGCDPKNDSTRLLLGRIAPSTILDLEREKKGVALTLADLVHEGWNGI